MLLQRTAKFNWNFPFSFFCIYTYKSLTSVDFKKCDSKAATCAKLVCPKSKISQLAALIGQDASEKVRIKIYKVTLDETI